MRMPASLPGKPGRRVTGRGACARCHLIVLGVNLAAAIVERTDHHRPVDIPIQEIHEYFLPDPGQRAAAPVGSRHGRHRRCYADPGAGAVVARRAGMAVRLRVRQPVVTAHASLPMELHLHPVIAVGVNRRSRRADDDGSLLAHDGRARMQHAPVRVTPAAAVRYLAADSVDPVAVGWPLPDRLAGRVQAGALLLVDCGSQQAHAEARVDIGAHLRAQVVVHQVDHAHDDKAALVVAGRRIKRGLPGEGKQRAWPQRAHGARANVDFLVRLEGLQLALGDALPLRARCVCVRARNVAGGKFGLAGAGRAGSVHRAGIERPVVPANELDGVGLQTQFGAPAVEGILAHRGAGL